MILTAASFALSKIRIRQDFIRPTRSIGLLYLFIALWILSIFGNDGDINQWERVKQIELFHWSLLFGLAAIAAIYHGIKEDDPMTRSFGITFLLIQPVYPVFRAFLEQRA
jgi:hypothetical protein